MARRQLIAAHDAVILKVAMMALTKTMMTVADKEWQSGGQDADAFPELHTTSQHEATRTEKLQQKWRCVHSPIMPSPKMPSCETFARFLAAPEA